MSRIADELRKCNLASPKPWDIWPTEGYDCGVYTGVTERQIGSIKFRKHLSGKVAEIERDDLQPPEELLDDDEIEEWSESQMRNNAKFISAARTGYPQALMALVRIERAFMRWNSQISRNVTPDPLKMVSEIGTALLSFENEGGVPDHIREILETVAERAGGKLAAEIDEYLKREA